MTALVIPQPRHSKSKKSFDGQTITPLSSKNVEGSSQSTIGTSSNNTSQTLVSNRCLGVRGVTSFDLIAARLVKITLASY
jgi:hypothetical protein